MSQSISWWSRIWAVVMVGIVGGCDMEGTFTQGINTPARVAPSTVQYRFESELITNAALVREDTMPRWQLGRHAFKRGPDNVLVISRIHSFAEKRSGGSRKVPKRYDANIERVWIVLPLGTQVGDTFRIDKLEYDFLTGYDSGKIADGEMYIQPIRLLGKLTILEVHSSSIVIDIDMVVEPRHFTRWNYKRVETVQVTTTGVRARPAELSAKERRLAAAQANNAKQTLGDADQGQDPTTQPADGDNPAATTQPADEPLDVGKYIVGKWVGISNNDVYDLRFQFDPSGTFIYSTCRSNAHPMIKSGRYRIKKGYVILDVDFFGSGTLKDRSHMKFLKPLEMFKIYPVNDNTVVMRMTQEDMLFRNPSVNEVKVSRGEFQDMFLVPPPLKK